MVLPMFNTLFGWIEKVKRVKIYIYFPNHSLISFYNICIYILPRNIFLLKSKFPKKYLIYLIFHLNTKLNHIPNKITSSSISLLLKIKKIKKKLKEKQKQ